jgi:hypothetical protein
VAPSISSSKANGQKVASPRKLKEEDVDNLDDGQVIFKVIIEENGIENKKYLVINKLHKFLLLLKSSRTRVDSKLSFDIIHSIERTYNDNRKVLVLLKESYQLRPISITFSSIFKVFQFLQLFQFIADLPDPLKSPIKVLKEEPSLDFNLQ